MSDENGTPSAGVKRVRKKPVEVEAMQMPFDTRPRYGEDGFHEIGFQMADAVRQIAVWMVENGYDGNPDGEDVGEWPEGETHVIDGERVGLPECGINYLEIATLEGEITASPGDWVIRGVNGEFYPCRDDIFRKTYEEVQDAAR